MQARRILHADKPVLGDHRCPNVMVKDKRVLIVDFDWCRVHEVHTYSFSLNDAHDSIDWHPEVKRLKVGKL